MKVGDLVEFKEEIDVQRLGATGRRANVFLVVRTEVVGYEHKVWIFPDPDEGSQRRPNALNYYYDHFFEVVNESR